MLISVIVPIFNVEKYLEKCVTSICKNTYKNIEIILVDDGSTDKCGQMCEKYIKKDSRIKVIHKENGGLSSARNAGIEVAKGDYYLFIDSDDYIDIEMIEYLVKAAEKYQSQVISGGYERIDENGNSKLKTLLKEKEYLGVNSILEGLFVENNISIVAWGKLYRKDIFEQGIRFLEGKNHEDNIFSMDLFEYIQSYVTISRCDYKYLIRDDSITKMAFNIKKLDALDANYYMLESCKRNWPQYEKYVWILLAKCCFYLYSDMKRASYNDGELKYKIRNEFKKAYWKSKEHWECVDKKDKLRFTFFNSFPNLSVKLYGYVSKG